MTLLTTYHMTHSARLKNKRLNYRLLDTVNKQKVIEVRTEFWFCMDCNIDFFREYRVGHLAETLEGFMVGRSMIVSTPEVMIGEVDF